MGKITKITKQRRGERVNVFVDGAFELGVALEVAVAEGLKVGMELDEERMRRLEMASDEAYWWDRSLKYLSRRPRSVKEMRDWWRRHEMPEEYEEKFVHKLDNLQFLGDAAFARWWVEQRQLQKKGLKVIRMELGQKGVDRSVVAEVMAEFDDDVVVLRQLAEKRWQRYAGKSLDEQKRKTTDFLLRRGYTFGQIRPIIDELASSSYTS